LKEYRLMSGPGMKRPSAADQIDPAAEDRLFEGVREAERF
jgi:hypothetical protein